MATPERIFYDLDDVLIHSTEQAEDSHVAVSVSEVSYGALLRPHAQQMLSFARRLTSTWMLTTATRDYALAMNEAFRLGFVPGEIISRDDFLADVCGHRVPISLSLYPNSVLIDNEAPTDFGASLKRAFLGKGHYIQVKAFRGRDSPAFGKQLGVMHEHLRRLFTTSPST